MTTYLSDTMTGTHKIAQVIVPLPVFDYLDYKIPQSNNQEYHIGDYVTVSIGSRIHTGIITEFKSASSFKKLKYILQKHEHTPPMSADMLEFIHKVAHYTLSPIGDVLKATLRGAAFDNKILMTDYIYVSDIHTKRITPQRQAIIDFLTAHTQTEATVLRQNFSVSIIRDMIKSGQLLLVQKPKQHNIACPIVEYCLPHLGDEQQIALDSFKDIYQPNTFLPFLLDGVTGSGKTETYLEIIADVWRKNPEAQILILIPEIGLVNQLTKRFEKRFGTMPALWHSQINDTNRQLIRTGISNGSIKCVIGARSGLFLPFKNLCIIVVDEEHDSSYKQQEGFRYHARDMAVMRANIEKIPIILASATPSLETFVNGEVGRYHKLQLRHRFNAVVMPQIHLVDLKTNQAPKAHWISPPLVQAIQTAAFNNEQSLLFLNRRGYAPLMLCKACGYRIECPFCSAWVVYHKNSAVLKCHQCGQHSQVPPKCGSCGNVDTFSPCGPGVERLYEEVKMVFPHLKSVVLSSDYSDSPDELEQILEEIRDNKIHILIGTQMIAKGHHFPHLTCVGIIDADLGLKGGDFRAFEKSFQMLEQVAGRAGREDKQGNVYVQTYNPEHDIMVALSKHDRDSFLDFEATNRLDALYPPFGRMIAVIVSCDIEKELVDYVRYMVKNVPIDDKISVFGPAPAPIFMLRGAYRYRFLIKTERKILPQVFVKAWIESLKIPRIVKIHIDVDPISFL